MWAASITRVTAQVLVRDSGRDSAISTTSPSLIAFVSSCAWYLFDFTMYLPYSGCFTRRSTSTVTVFSILLLTTSPTRVRVRGFFSAFIWRRPSGSAPCGRARCRGACASAGRCSAVAAWRAACATRNAPSAVPAAPSGGRRRPSCAVPWRSCAFSLLAELTDDKRRLQRQLGSGERKCLACHGFVDAVQFIDDVAGPHLGHPVLRVALADLGRLLGDGLVREHADPHAPATLDVAADRAASRFDLARGQATALGHLQAEFTERDGGAAQGEAAVTALVLLAVLASSGLQHGYSPSFAPPSGLASPGVLAATLRTRLTTGLAAASFGASAGAASAVLVSAVLVSAVLRAGRLAGGRRSPLGRSERGRRSSRSGAGVSVAAGASPRPSLSPL